MKRLLVLSVICLAAQTFALDHWKGKQKALVILLQWANTPTQVTLNQVHQTFFSDTGLSLRTLFLENSNSTFDFSGEVYDWKNSTVKWNPEDGCKLTNIVSEAWKVFSSSIDISKFDSDGDGKIDNFFVVHSGRIDSDRVGPECTFTTFSKANHAIVFQSQGLGSIGDSIPIGFYVHEAGHGYFNFPDLYNDHYHGRYGIGMWGMMGLGTWGTYNLMPTRDMFRFPGHFEPLSKIKIGWIKPRILQSASEKVVLKPIETSGDIIAIPAGSGTNYYLEYRSKRGFSQNHLGHGLLIWKNWALIQADGKDDMNHGHDLGHRPVPPVDENFGDGSDPFPGTGGVKNFEDSKVGFRLSNITQFDDRIEFSLEVDSKKQIPAYTEPVVPVFDGVEKF